jgi:hypothetical protein
MLTNLETYLESLRSECSLQGDKTMNEIKSTDAVKYNNQIKRSNKTKQNSMNNFIDILLKKLEGNSSTNEDNDANVKEAMSYLDNLSKFPVKEIILDKTEPCSLKTDSFNNNYQLFINENNVLHFIAILPGLDYTSLVATFEDSTFNFKADYLKVINNTNIASEFLVEDTLVVSKKLDKAYEIVTTSTILTEPTYISYRDGILVIYIELVPKNYSKKVEIKLLQ